MRKINLRQFDYQKVAETETAMWRAYYNHQFFKLFWQLLRLIKSQLGLSWILTLRLAYHAAWAAADYRLHKGKENYQRPLTQLIKFYRLIAEHATESFDFKKAGELELEWWDIHRYPKKYKKTLEESLIDGVATVYNVAPNKLKSSVHYRAVAMMIPDHEGDKQAIPPDWQKVHELLIKAWQSLHAAVQKS